MKKETADPSQTGLQDMFRPPVETPAMLLEARMEAAGRRMAVYLRHLPLPERTRHELALAALTELAKDPGVNPVQAEARGMRILRGLLSEQTPAVHVVPGPGVRRRHMRPEEMDRRPWVRVYLNFMRPLWIMAAGFFNTALIDFLLYALLLAGLRIMDMQLP
ncbi:hypothetical protein [Desulfomicrobium escambiense]|uniref:hypothetical protein n=1 Tax=Desulfomicrobium escambiense TaxID=29503 RepID=UPI000414B8BA|nr:hypothetical protein [Desulfomicrobium escambiense]